MPCGGKLGSQKFTATPFLETMAGNTFLVHVGNRADRSNGIDVSIGSQKLEAQGPDIL